MRKGHRPAVQPGQLPTASLPGRVERGKEPFRQGGGSSNRTIARAAPGLGIITAGHRHGWPVAAGGSGSITAALAALLADLGGKIETGARVRAASELPAADVTLFDLAPGAIADILGDRLPARVARAYRRYRHGPGAFKADFAVEGGVPWTNPDARRAGTVHLGGTFAEIAATERDIHAGRMPERPFVLAGQQYLADPGRSAGNVHPLWTYAHVPHGYTGDATEAIVAQIERFAPGFRDRIVGRAVRSTTQWPHTTPTTSAGTSSPVPRTSARLCLALARPFPRTGSACPACTSARQRPHRAPACTGCAAPTRPPTRCITCTGTAPVSRPPRGHLAGLSTDQRHRRRRRRSVAGGVSLLGFMAT